MSRNVRDTSHRLKINVEVAKMAMSALERKAAFKAAVTLQQLTMAEAAAKLGVSYNHLVLVLRGERVGSTRLEEKIAEFVGRPVREMFRRRGKAIAVVVANRP